MKNKRHIYYIYGCCLIISLLLCNLSYAQNIMVDFRQSYGGIINEKGVQLKDRVQVNNMLIGVKAIDPFDPNKVIWNILSFDVIFKACLLNQQYVLMAINYRPSNTEHFLPLFEQEPPCNNVLDFSNSYTMSIPDKPNWLEVKNIRSHTEVTNHYNVRFEFNTTNLALEQRGFQNALPPHQVNISLDWDSISADLDAHLTGPAPGAPKTFNNEVDRFHIYFSNKKNDVAILKIGEFSQTKPEVVTIFPPQKNTKTLRTGLYRFTVHNFKGSGTIVESKAKVRLQIGNDPEQLFTPPPIKNSSPLSSRRINSSGERLGAWVVFELLVTDDGMVAVRPIQKYLSNVNPSQIP